MIFISTFLSVSGYKDISTVNIDKQQETINNISSEVLVEEEQNNSTDLIQPPTEEEYYEGELEETDDTNEGEDLDSEEENTEDSEETVEENADDPEETQEEPIEENKDDTETNDENTYGELTEDSEDDEVVELVSPLIPREDVTAVIMPDIYNYVTEEGVWDYQGYAENTGLDYTFEENKIILISHNEWAVTMTVNEASEGETIITIGGFDNGEITKDGIFNQGYDSDDITAVEINGEKLYFSSKALKQLDALIELTQWYKYTDDAFAFLSAPIIE